MIDEALISDKKNIQVRFSYLATPDELNNVITKDIKRSDLFLYAKACDFNTMEPQLYFIVSIDAGVLMNNEKHNAFFYTDVKTIIDSNNKAMNRLLADTNGTKKPWWKFWS